MSILRFLLGMEGKRKEITDRPEDRSNKKEIIRPDVKKRKVIREIDIERREDLEERLGYEFKGLFAFIDNESNVNINGELHTIEEREPDCNIYIIISAKDSEGRVLQVVRDFVNFKDFYMLKTFLKKFNMGELTDSLEKLFIYVEKC